MLLKLELSTALMGLLARMQTLPTYYCLPVYIFDYFSNDLIGVWLFLY